MKGLFVSLLLSGLCQAVRVYLHPDPSLPPRLSTNHAGAVLSSHLGLERFEDAVPAFFGEQEVMVGAGLGTGLLLTISEEDVHDVVPHALKKSSFSVSSVNPDSLSSIIPSYLDRAHHVYSHVYENSASSRLVASIKDFLDGDYAPDRFAAFDLSALSTLKHTLGADDESVVAAYTALHSTLVSLLARPDVKLALVSVPTPGAGLARRQQPPQSPLPPSLPGSEPIDSISTCYSSADVCGNATSACSGHGTCTGASKAGRTCFVCACSTTKDAKGRRENWAGRACERKDVSGPFVLLAGTTVALLLLVGGSVALLGAVGSDKLPSVLIGGVAHSNH
ncbi:uncharacterized protein BXZ73DRAFT_47983 [Epithele typhae]|uniref:uncharacterized protein n=1 Tax=Epithele typhae TaxID=378194 RepID=UPI002007BF69|nr:uncharacterized protein BXZ73DRAFT_47983 [Epithele typhae]KAH9929583.1 hypothetical protein BXZ73DRAFT_47983 [Epithele typhae]